jgi:hypothetical protein
MIFSKQQRTSAGAVYFETFCKFDKLSRFGTIPQHGKDKTIVKVFIPFG